MKIINIINDTSVKVTGTALQGFINTTYDDIVAAFGEPTYTHGDKTNVEWNLEFVIKLQDAPGSFIEEVCVATIYDWKLPSTPYGLYNWHIGGFSNEAVECVYSSLQQKVL